MANVLGEFFTDIANAIRSKTGSTDTMKPTEFLDQIMSIEQNEGCVTVTFMDGDTEVFSRPVYIGDDCPDPIIQERIEVPTKESTAQYDYVHSGWALSDGAVADGDILKNIQTDMIVYNAFESNVRYYTINFYDGETLLYTEQIAYGTVPSYKPTHVDPENYLFDKWEPAISSVTGNADYTVVWKQKRALADYTWAELDTLSIDEIRASFKIGDQKSLVDNSSGLTATLIGIEHDDLADGSGKARMTFALNYMPYTYTHNNKKWGNDSDWGTSTLNPSYHFSLYGESELLKQTYVADVKPFVKTVKKKYNKGNSYTFGESNDTFFALSLAEFGYSAFSDGNRYEYFTSKKSSDVLENKASVAVDIFGAASGSSMQTWTRTFYSSSQAYVVQLGKVPINVSKSYGYSLTCGFCI